MLKQGIYEHIISQETKREIIETEQSGLVCVQQSIDSAESPKVLADYLAYAIRQKLEEIEGQQDRVALINRIMMEAGLRDDLLIAKPTVLLTEVMSKQQTTLQSASSTHTARPISGFRVSNLFTGGSSALSLSEELRREIASADEICFIVSFLKVSGVRLLLNDLKTFCSRRDKRLRIITTTYCGATQAKAIEQLAGLSNTEIRISYNTDIECLHAKSYIFVRNSGMHTAYIGSSNLSKSAQTEGLEWNVRVASIENQHIIKTALATFEMYWNSPNFEDFRLGGIEKFNKEIDRNTSRTTSLDMVYQKYTILPHQKQILDRLHVEREDRGNYRNLIVAATGTGKTELTVLDFMGQANRKYDFANRFRALTLQPDKSIQRQIKEGFTLLPSGCSIMMEKKARQYILDNIKSAIYNKTRIVREINSYINIPTISQFLENNGQDIRVLYQGTNCWSSLKRAAGRLSYTDDSITKRLEKGMSNLLHHNSASFLRFVERFVLGEHVHLDIAHKTYALMLYYALFQDRIGKSGLGTITEALDLLHKPQYACFREELAEIVSYLLTNLSIKTTAIAADLFPWLELYGCYTREEIFTLVGRQTADLKMQGAASGSFNLPEHNAVLLFVTLNKSEKDFSPSTQYDDYLINDLYFHWQSKNTDAHHNKGGRLYTEQLQNKRKVILFVRQEKRDGFGNTSAFHCFGLVDYVSSYDDFPMNVTWRLHQPAMAQYLKAI